jgi:CelD/BcsL family acetyltransferase involved in cellulose biosynthesis
MSLAASQSLVSEFGKDATDAQGRLDCHIITTIEDVRALAPDWGQLWRSNPNSHIFQRFELVSSWLTAFGAIWRPYIPVVTSDDNVIGIVPLVIRNRELRFAGHLGSDYNELVCNPNSRTVVFRTALETLFTRTDEWDRIVLENIPDDSGIQSCLGSLPEKIRKHIASGPTTDCPTLIFGENHHNLEEILQKENLRRTVRVFERLGPVTFRHLESLDDVAIHLAQFVQQHIRRNKLAGRISALNRPEAVRFIELLATRLDLKRDLRFSVLELNRKPAAYLLGYISAGRYILHKPTFDIDLSDHSPGLVLLYRLWHSLANGNATEFDFTVGPEPYKYRFANHIRHNIDLTIYRPGIIGTTHRRLASVRRSVADRIKGNERFGDMLRDTIGQVRSRGICQLALARLQTHVFSREHSSVYIQLRPLSAQSAGALIPATLSALADHTGDSGGIDAARLQIARERMKHKDVAYFMARPGRQAEVAWTQRTNTIDLTNRNVTLDATALVVYDYWHTASRSYRVPSVEFLNALSAESIRLKLPLCIVAPANGSARRLLNAAGFASLATYRNYRLLGYAWETGSNRTSLVLNVDPM